LLVEISTSIQTNDIVVTTVVPGVSYSTQKDDNIITAAIIGVPVAVSVIFVVVFSTLICRKFKSRRG